MAEDSSRLRFTRPSECFVTETICFSRARMYCEISSILVSAADFSISALPLAMLLTVTSNQAMALEARAGLEALASPLAFNMAASSACRKVTKNSELPISLWLAMRWRNFSRPLLRLSTNSLPKRPTVCFSGKGGTITPGNSRDSSPLNQEKSLYLRTTVIVPEVNPGRLAVEVIL